MSLSTLDKLIWKSSRQYVFIEFRSFPKLKKKRDKMSLKLRDFAKSDAGSENVSRDNVEDNSDDEISYLPPG